MSAERALIDTGPLVALFSVRDRSHVACSEALQALSQPPLTCWPVITEAAWLLRGRSDWLNSLLRAVEAGFVELADLTASDMPAVRAILARFESLNPRFADACLVHLAEREGIDTIFTLDRRDFSVYRTSRGKGFRLLPEEP